MKLLTAPETFPPTRIALQFSAGPGPVPLARPMQRITEEDTMRAPQVTFHGLKPSAQLRHEIRDRAAWLERFYPRLMACRVRLQVPHRHRSHGRPMHVTIEMSVPGHEKLVITHEPPLPHGRVAIRKAFDAARRRLEDFEAQRI